jgi:hypothetical protein
MPCCTGEGSSLPSNNRPRQADAGGAGAVLDDERLAKPLGKFVADDAHGDVCQSAGGETLMSRKLQI